MACGPTFACLFQTKFKIYKLTFNEDTIPGWIMAFSWLVYLLWLWISFREPSHQTEQFLPQQSNSGLSSANDCAVEIGFTQPLLLKSEAEHQNEETEQDLEDLMKILKEIMNLSPQLCQHIDYSPHLCSCSFTIC